MTVATDERVSDLVRHLERFAELSRDMAVNPHRHNTEFAKVDAHFLEVVADPRARELLRQVSLDHPDPLVRASLRDNLNPWVPADTGPELDAWLDHPAVDLGILKDVLQVRQCLALPEIAAHDQTTQKSWLAGRPSTGGGPWPRDRQGRALALVVQVCLDADWLSDATLAWARSWGLPTRGVLQVFHDLWSEEPDALCVRHVSDPGDDVEEYPEDYDLIVHPARSTADLLTLSVRSPLDVDGLDEAMFDGWTEVAQRFADAHASFLIEEFNAPGRPVTTMLGYGWSGERESLENADFAHPPEDFVLLLDIPGVRHLENWFGDEGHLEVWIRREDLSAGRFDGARPLLRMG